MGGTQEPFIPQFWVAKKNPVSQVDQVISLQTLQLIKNTASETRQDFLKIYFNGNASNNSERNFGCFVS